MFPGRIPPSAEPKCKKPLCWSLGRAWDPVRSTDVPAAPPGAGEFGPDPKKRAACVRTVGAKVPPAPSPNTDGNENLVGKVGRGVVLDTRIGGEVRGRKPPLLLVLAPNPDAAVWTVPSSWPPLLKPDSAAPWLEEVDAELNGAEAPLLSELVRPGKMLVETGRMEPGSRGDELELNEFDPACDEENERPDEDLNPSEFSPVAEVVKAGL